MRAGAVPFGLEDVEWIRHAVSVFVEEGGYAIGNEDHRFAPGCASPSADKNAIAIPKRGSDYDDAQLTA